MVNYLTNLAYESLLCVVWFNKYSVSSFLSFTMNGTNLAMALQLSPSLFGAFKMLQIQTIS